MSVEKEARKALRRMVLWRLVGEMFVLPQVLIRGLAGMLTVLGSWFKNLELAVFYMELDAARRFHLLTGLDFGSASGEPGRYRGIGQGEQEEQYHTGEDDDE